MEKDQTSLMEMATPQQRQAVSNTVQAALQMLVKVDLKIYGKVSEDTLASIQTQGFILLQNGTVQKNGAARTEIVQHEQETAAKSKPSVRGQLRSAAKEMEQCPHPESRAKGGEAR